jgi:Domain of unknown function (DUF6532)
VILVIVFSYFRGNDIDISLQIVGRASQIRGYAKTTSRPYFISAYKIDSLGHVSKREVRDSVEQHLEGARFIYKVIHCPCTIVLLLTVYIFFDTGRILYRKQAYSAPLLYKLSSIRSGSKIKRMTALYTLSFPRMMYFQWLPSLSCKRW